MKQLVVAAFGLLAIVAAAACSSDSSDSGASAGASGTAGSKLAPDPKTCVQPGDKGNSLGIGTPCTPAGGECKDLKLACLADLGQEEWFCTKIGCKYDDQCGEATLCHQEGGSACVPARCGTTGSGNAGSGGAAGGAGSATAGSGGAGAAGTGGAAAGTAGAGGQ